MTHTVFGGNSEEDTPVPIPNTEVKLFSADGTAWETTWESRTPPDQFKKPLVFTRGFFYVAFFSTSWPFCFTFLSFFIKKVNRFLIQVVRYYLL
jgi:hypothetical protein